MTTNMIDPPKDGFAVANNPPRSAAKVAGLLDCSHSPSHPYWFDSPMEIFEMTVRFGMLFKGLKSAGDQMQAGAAQPFRR